METLLTGTKLVIPLLTLGVAAALFLGGCRHHRGECRGRWGEDPQRAEEALRRHLDGALDDLDAGEDQRAQVAALADRLLPRALDLVEERDALRDDLRAAWAQETLDPVPLHDRVDRQAGELTGFAHELVDAAAELHGILTPDQRARLAERWARSHRR